MDFLYKVLNFFELVIYTASTKEYAEQVINKLDPQRKILKYRLYREDCLHIGGHFVKDLSRLGRDLSHVIILDNSITSFAHHLDNGIPILSWFDDQNDGELWKVGNLLEQLVNTQDVRPILNSLFNLPKMIEEYQRKCFVSN
jgi:CTD small phosphatase-like protein 2